MSSDSPVAILYNELGVSVNVQDGYSIPVDTTGILSAGTDGGTARFIHVNSSGNQVITGAGTAGTADSGVVTVQGIAGGTALPISGSITATNASIGANASSIPTSSTLIGGSDGTNLQPIHVFDLDSGGGTQYVQGVNLRLSSSGGSVEFGTGSNPIRIDPTGSTTQPVSGTVTANIGTSGLLALDATLTGGTQTTRITDGTNTATVKAASTSAVASDKALVVAFSPNNSIVTNADGYVTTSAPSYTNNTFQPISLTTAGLLRIDGSGVTQPISAASLPLPTGAATETTLSTRLADSTFTGRINTLGQKTMTNSTPVVLSSDQSSIPVTQSGTWTVQPGNTANTTPWLATINQGGNSAAVTGSNALKVDGSAVTQPVSGTITANIGTSGSLALDATLAKLTISQSAALGSNTQSLMGGSVTTASPSYTTGNINPLSLTVAGALRIDGSATTQPVSGTVTANAGTGNFTIIGTGTDNTTNSIAKLPVLSARANTSAPTWTDGYMVPLSVDTSGALRVGGSITATNASISTTGSSPPASATYIGGSVTTAAPSYTTGQMNALSLTVAGALRTDSSGTTQPVSGTITANIGTSGSLALDATLAKLTISQSTALGSNTLAMVGGSVTTAAPTYTTGNINPLSLMTTGALRIDNSSWLGSTAPTVGSKTSANSLPVVIASDQGSLTVNSSATDGLVDNAGFTDGTSRVQPVGYIFDEVAGTALTENDIAAARLDSKRSQIFVIEDGTTRGTRTTVKGASTSAVAGDTALVVAISPNNTVAISGTVTANIGTSGSLALDATLAKLTVAQSTALGSNTLAMVGGSVTTAAPTYTTGNINPLSLTTGGLLRIDGSGVTQPVSGTITANIGTSGALALDATLTGGTQTTRITDGTNTATVKAASTAAVAADKAVVVAISPNNTVEVTSATAANLKSQVVGAGAAGAAATGNPVLVAGYDGTNARIIRTTPSGGVQLAADQLIGSAIPATGLLMGASDGTNLQALLVMTSTPVGTEVGLVTRNIPYTPPTATLANVGASVTSVTLIASNTSRKGATVHNDSTALLYIKFGSAAATNSFTVRVAAQGYYEVPFGYSGIITGVWASATGNARVTEIT